MSRDQIYQLEREIIISHDFILVIINNKAFFVQKR